MDRRIIFVHGMGDKPEPYAERERTWTPLNQALWLDVPYDAYSVAYWADLRKPMIGATPSPAQEALLRRLPVKQRATLGWAIGGLGAYWNRPDLLALNAIERLRRVSRLSLSRAERLSRPVLDLVFERLMRDLRPYLDGRTRPTILERVVAHLDQERKAGPLCVISHSMGTVVAFDAIRKWQGDVDTFITLGTPLGWEYVREGIGRPPYPPTIHHWWNLFDRLDDAAIRDRGIAGDYPTAEGAHLVNDHTVRDNFSEKGDRDPHHWFGYLSSPEVAEIVCQFWLGGRPWPRSAPSPVPRHMAANGHGA